MIRFARVLLLLLVAALAAVALVGAPDLPIRRASTKRRAAIADRARAAQSSRDRDVSYLMQNRRDVASEIAGRDVSFDELLAADRRAAADAWSRWRGGPIFPERDQ